MNPILLLLLSSGLSGRRCRDFEEDPWLFLMAEQAGDEQAVSWIGAISLGHFYIRGKPLSCFCLNSSLVLMGRRQASDRLELVLSGLSQDTVLGMVTLRLLFSSARGERGFPFQ